MPKWKYLEVLAIETKRGRTTQTPVCRFVLGTESAAWGKYGADAWKEHIGRLRVFSIVSLNEDDRWINTKYPRRCVLCMFDSGYVVLEHRNTLTTGEAACLEVACIQIHLCVVRRLPGCMGTGALRIPCTKHAQRIPDRDFMMSDCFLFFPLVAEEMTASNP